MMVLCRTMLDDAQSNLDSQRSNLRKLRAESHARSRAGFGRFSGRGECAGASDAVLPLLWREMDDGSVISCKAVRYAVAMRC